MKAVSTPLLALINAAVAGTGTCVDYDLYTITTASGSVIRFTTADFDIDCGSGTSPNGLIQPSGLYPARGLKVDQKGSKTQAHWKTGLDADTWTVVVAPRAVDPVTGEAFPDKIGNVPWLQAAQSGALDFADFQVDRAYFASVPTWPMPPGGATPVGTITIFAGVVGEVDTTDSIASLVVNDYRSILGYTMPRHFYQAPCRHTLFDAGCTLSAAAFANSGTAGAGSTQSVIVAATLPAPPSGPGSGTYTLGRIVFTSGSNAGLQATVGAWDGGVTLTLFAPLPYAIVAGDAFTIYLGCNKTMSACTSFANLANYGGFPFLPYPELSA